MVVREFRQPVKIILFLSSYVPLFLIMGIRLWNVGPMLIDIYPVPYLNFKIGLSYFTGGIVVLCAIFTILVYQIVQTHSERGTTQRPIDTYQKRNELLSTYLLVYVFVFAGLNFTQPLDIAIFVVFFFILGVLQINSGHLHVNPMLGLRGYQVYELTSDEQVLLIISDGSLEEKIMSPESQSSSDARDKVEVVSLDNTTALAP
ncbi:hypothetical protein [Haloarcula marina]|uniref:hypothetical protein n=1 Tax=Haloarcula marina TaxID=2961574 RepID=UPI0020B6B26D|nr:hypothetical protein [Halomicroarcula marina]